MTTATLPAARIAAILTAIALVGALAADPAVAAPAAAGSALAGTADQESGTRRQVGEASAAAAGTRDTVPGSFVVTTRSGTAAVRGRLPGWLAHGPTHAVVATLADGVARVSVRPAVAERAQRALQSLPGVVAVEPERVWSYAAAASGPPNDERYGEQWSHRATDAAGAWAITTGRADLRMAIIDSGVDARHPDLTGRVVAQERIVPNSSGGYSAVGGTADNDGCRIGHGTMVAGVAAAAGDNGLGVTGVAWEASVVDIALSAPADASAAGCTSEEAAPTDAKVITALGRIASGAHGHVDVVNLSLGGRQVDARCPVGLQQAIDQVRSRGAVVVAAAGNEGDLGIQVPAACRGVIAVAAADSDGTRASYSGMGRYVDVAAPAGDGEGVLTTCRIDFRPPVCGGTDYASPNGTSFAAPYVSGILALLRSDRPGLGADEVESILEQTAVHPLGRKRHSHQLGWGNVQAGAALRLATSGLAVPPPRRHPAVRLSAGTGSTAPVEQAVAVSRSAFARASASHAVIARADDFADALAGSSLAYGVGPLLFALPTGGLPAATRDELTRALPRNRTVYLLGGHGALDPRLESELEALGYRPKRLAGRVREETAVAVAREMARPGGPHTRPAIIVATRGNWPDAVAAGSLGSLFGLPILLTPPGELHRFTADYLRELRAAGRPMDRVYVVGGEGVVSGAAAKSAADASGGRYQRLAGAARDQTAVAVGHEVLRQLWGAPPSFAIAVDLDRADSFAHALSASALAGNTGAVFVPVRGPSAPSRITGATAAFACGLRVDGAVAGDVDLLPEPLAEELLDILEGSSPRC